MPLSKELRELFAGKHEPEEPWNNLEDMNKSYINLQYVEWLISKSRNRWAEKEGEIPRHPSPKFVVQPLQGVTGYKRGMSEDPDQASPPEIANESYSGNKKRKLDHFDQTPPPNPISRIDGGNDAPFEANVSAEANAPPKATTTSSAAAEIEKHFPGARSIYYRLGAFPPMLKMLLLDTCSVPVEYEFFRSSRDLDKADIKACFELVKRTSGADYKASSIGWKPKNKMKEMLDGEMMYLVVRKGDGGEKEDKEAEGGKGAVLGFISFMFTNDDPPMENRRVVYIYEIHLDTSLQGYGLGSKLIAAVESAALRVCVTKTMLTVFKSNRRAVGLYVKLGYGLDSATPGDRVVRDRVIKPDYVIMSKELPKELASPEDEF